MSERIKPQNPFLTPVRPGGERVSSSFHLHLRLCVFGIVSVPVCDVPTAQKVTLTRNMYHLKYWKEARVFCECN